MDYEIVELPARTVVGPTVRASNNSSGEGAVIGQLWARFLGEGLLVGCQTDAEAPEGMERQEIPAGRYAKVEIRGGDCVASMQEVWEAAWADEELTAQRAFTVDFEAYLPGEDMACADIDVFLALK